MIGVKADAAIPTKEIKRQLMPARNRAKTPEHAIKREVPKSGWRAINKVGRATNVNPISICHVLGGKLNRLIYQATIIGTASFIISEG